MQMSSVGKIAYNFEAPILLNGAYFFCSESGVKYEMRFVRKKNSYLSYGIAFGVVNDEYEGEEYCMTNKGEVFRVMNTVMGIINNFLSRCDRALEMEFSCEGSSEKKQQQRMKLYQRSFKNAEIPSWNFNVIDAHSVCLKKSA